jgi:hypothetical protein
MHGLPQSFPTKVSLATAVQCVLNYADQYSDYQQVDLVHLHFQLVAQSSISKVTTS